MTRLTPASIQRSMSASVRMPPPSCTGTDTDERIFSTAALFTAWPCTAPFRSTTWIQWKPASTNAFACAPGSVLKTVAVERSPCRTRTHWPSFRSIAG